MTRATTTAWTLADWANHLANAFRDWERVAHEPGDRDTVLVRFVLSILAYPGEPASAELLELVDRIRAGTQEVVW